MARKRSFEDVEKLDDLDRPIASTRMSGAVLSLSPVKRGRKSLFFDGTIADEYSKVRFVGFDAQQQHKLNEFQQKNVSVELINCEVKSSRHGEGYEVMLKSGTQIRPSPKKLDVSTIMVQMATVPKTITLITLADTEVWEKVSVNVKVVEVKEVFQLHDRVKQDVIVADQTGVVKVCLWEDHVNCMEEKTCYSLKNFVVREFQSTKYLSMPKEGTEIIEIDDIGDVAKDSGSSEEEILLQNVTVIGVPYLSSYKACLSCKARVEPQTPPLGKCSKVNCQMMQRYDVCAEQTTAKLMLMYEAEGQNKIVHSHAYGNVMKEIAGCAGDVSAEMLLRAAKLKSVTLIKDKSIVKDVKRD